jgi:Uncharacterized conserved protein (DUF2190)
MPGLQDRSLTGQQETTQFAHTAATTAMTPIVINGHVWIPLNTVAANALNSYMTFGLLSDGAQAAVAIAAGDKIYWDNAASKFTNVLTSNTLCGYALEASASGGPTGIFRFDTFGA